MRCAIPLRLLLATVLVPATAFGQRAAEPLRATWPEQMVARRQAAHDEIASGLRLNNWYATAPIQVKAFSDNPIAVGPPNLKAVAGNKPLWDKWPIQAEWFYPAQMPQGSVLYFTRKITVARQVSIALTLCRADGMEGWLDGKSFLRRNAEHPSPPGQEQVELPLAPGEHWLTFKVYKNAIDPEFHFISTGVMDQGFANGFRGVPAPGRLVHAKRCPPQQSGRRRRRFFRRLARLPGAPGHADGADDDRPALAELGPNAAGLREELNQRVKTGAGPENPAWLALLRKACRQRREIRLKPLLARTKTVLFAKHQVFASRSGIYLHTEYEGCPQPSSLCQIDLAAETKDSFAPHSILFDAGDGIVRNPELSFDAAKLLFAWRPTRNDLKITTPPRPATIRFMRWTWPCRTRQLTTEETYGAAFEPCCLPNGDIMFSSSRIVQHITCGWGDCSNLFIMNKREIRPEVGFDQDADRLSRLAGGRARDLHPPRLQRSRGQEARARCS